MNQRSVFYDARRKDAGRPAAAALYYDPVGTDAPEIVATGRGLLAEEMIAVAKHGVPLHQDAGLVEALSKLDVGTVIPRELYAVVAEVLAFVYTLDAESAG